MIVLTTESTSAVPLWTSNSRLGDRNTRPNYLRHYMRPDTEVSACTDSRRRPRGSDNLTPSIQIDSLGKPPIHPVTFTALLPHPSYRWPRELPQNRLAASDAILPRNRHPCSLTTPHWKSQHGYIRTSHE